MATPHEIISAQRCTIDKLRAEIKKLTAEKEEIESKYDELVAINKMGWRQIK